MEGDADHDHRPHRHRRCLRTVFVITACPAPVGRRLQSAQADHRVGMAVLQGVPRLTLGWADLLGDPVEERLHLRTTMLQRQLEPAMQEAVVITPLPQRPTVPTRRRLSRDIA
jgi:hypothetical protein